MFESLKAAKSARFALSDMQGPSGKRGAQIWTCSILFYGAIVGSATGHEKDNTFVLVMHKGLQEQIAQSLKDHGFALDLSKTPSQSIRPDTTTNFLRLAIAQIADEMDMLEELRKQLPNQTLVIHRSNPGRVVVYPIPFSPQVKADLLTQHGPELLEFLNESVEGL